MFPVRLDAARAQFLRQKNGALLFWLRGVRRSRNSHCLTTVAIQNQFPNCTKAFEFRDCRHCRMRPGAGPLRSKASSRFSSHFESCRKQRCRTRMTLRFTNSTGSRSVMQTTTKRKKSSTFERHAHVGPFTVALCAFLASPVRLQRIDNFANARNVAAAFGNAVLRGTGRHLAPQRDCPLRRRGLPPYHRRRCSSTSGTAQRVCSGRQTQCCLNSVHSTWKATRG